MNSKKNTQFVLFLAEGVPGILSLISFLKKYANMLFLLVGHRIHGCFINMAKHLIIYLASPTFSMHNTFF